jgi:hypothetical protein
MSTLSIASSLTTSSNYALTHPLVAGLFATSALTLPIFIIIERRAAEPILPMSMLTRLQPSLALGGFFLLTASNFSRVSAERALAFAPSARSLSRSTRPRFVIPARSRYIPRCNCSAVVDCCSTVRGMLESSLTRRQLYMQPVYLHVTRGLNGGQTGLVLLPSSIVGSASSLYAGWHMRVSRSDRPLLSLFSDAPSPTLGLTRYAVRCTLYAVHHP